MNISYSKNFIKQAKKLDLVSRQKLSARLKVFRVNPTHVLLRNHSLVGKYKDYRSIDVAGDLRVLYLQSGEDVIFDVVGTHSQLYG